MKTLYIVYKKETDMVGYFWYDTKGKAYNSPITSDKRAFSLTFAQFWINYLIFEAADF